MECKACGAWFSSGQAQELCPTCERALDRLKGYAVPVVRCANCFYAFKVDAREPMYDCSHLSREGCTQWVASDDFCSYGERRR